MVRQFVPSRPSSQWSYCGFFHRVTFWTPDHLQLQMNYLSSNVATTLLWTCMAFVFFIGCSLGNPKKRTTGLLSDGLDRRSFLHIQCKGFYDTSIFARLDRICEDCYNLFREPQLYPECRKKCFTTVYFKACLDALQLSDEVQQYQTWVIQLQRTDSWF